MRGLDRVTETTRIRAAYDRQAGKYDRMIRPLEVVLFGGGREWVCARTYGEVLEVAVGTGRNLAFYPPGVHLTGVELSPAMLTFARRRAERLGVRANLQVGDAENLPFADASFDSIVITLALCTIPDDRAALSQAWRVLRPGGRLALLEHVRSTLAPVRLVQQLLEPLFLGLGGDHLLRDPLDHLAAAGFAVEQVERSRWGVVARLLARKAGTA